MRKLFKGQRILSVLYILASIGMFLFALAFMTEYNDLFGLKLPQNQEIAMFHDVILQTFNRQIFAWSLVGVIGIALIVFLEILSCVPDRFALVPVFLLRRIEILCWISGWVKIVTFSMVYCPFMIKI